MGSCERNVDTSGRGHFLVWPKKPDAVMLRASRSLARINTCRGNPGNHLLKMAETHTAVPGWLCEEGFPAELVNPPDILSQLEISTVAQPLVTWQGWGVSYCIEPPPPPINT